MQHDPSKAFVLLNNLGLGRRLGHDWTDRCGHLLIYLHRPFLFIHLAYTDTHSFASHFLFPENIQHFSGDIQTARQEVIKLNYYNNVAEYIRNQGDWS